MCLLVSVFIAFLSIALVFDGISVESNSSNEKIVSTEENVSSIKTKRGIHGYALPTYGQRYFPSYKSSHPTYALRPGDAVVYSFNVNYPKVLRPSISPILFHRSVPTVYANRFAVLIQKPVVVQKPIIPIAQVSQYSTPTYIPGIPPHIHSVNPLTITNKPQPPLISQNGWNPTYYPVSPSVRNTRVLQPAVTVLSPSNLSHLPIPSLTQTPNNYYLPPDPSASEQHHHHQHHDHDLQMHLQHLQEIQRHQNFLRSEQNEGIVTPLSEQGYETASNNGQYSGPSSYEVQLNSRGRLS